MPDGFVYEDAGIWRFQHNNVNDGNDADIFQPFDYQNTPIDGILSDVTDFQAYLDALIPAFDLSRPVGFHL